MSNPHKELMYMNVHASLFHKTTHAMTNYEKLLHTETYYNILCGMSTEEPRKKSVWYV